MRERRSLTSKNISKFALESVAAEVADPAHAGSSLICQSKQLLTQTRSMIFVQDDSVKRSVG
jgi:hypothetical protein